MNNYLHYFRKYLKYLNYVLVIILIFSSTASLAVGKRYDYESYTLNNGLQVILIPNNRAPVVYHAIWYKVGSADSPNDKTGLAHFLEHMMFNGSKKFPNDSYKRKITDLGGEQNANTTWDRTGYFVTIAKEHLPVIMEMEADRMQNLQILPKDIEKEREVVLQERRSTSDAQPMELLAEAANASFFWQHPYGKPVIGFEEHIRKYTDEDVNAFYQKWYTPNNAILVIAGDIQNQSLKPLIEQYYGTIPKRSNPKRERPVEPNHRGTNAKVEIRSPQLGPFFQKIYRAPNHRTANLRLEATLMLLQDILGDPTFGRLSQALVENNEVAHSVSAGYTGSFYDPYSFTISGAPINACDLAWLESNVDAEIRRLISEGVTEKELCKAKEQWQYDSLYRQGSLQGIADFYGEHLCLGYTEKDLNEWLDVIASITQDEIKIAAKDILGKGPEVTLYTHTVVQK